MTEELEYRFYYVHRDGWVSNDGSLVKGKCVRVIEATSQEDAERQAREFGDIN